MDAIAAAIHAAKVAGRKIGICGQAPSDHPGFAAFLVKEGIDSISLNPDVVLKTTLAILEAERSLDSPQPEVSWTARPNASPLPSVGATV